jgi:hypothetical protein
MHQENSGWFPNPLLLRMAAQASSTPAWDKTLIGFEHLDREHGLNPATEYHSCAA